MLNLRQNQSAFSLVELLVGLAIVAVLATAAAPSLSAWVNNAQIRTTADAIQNGLQLARGEAVRLNTLMRFQLTSSTDNTCALSAINSNWVVSQFDPSAACGTAPANSGAIGNPLIVQVRPSSDGSGSSVDTAGQSAIGFNGLGRQISVTNIDGTTTPNPPVTVTIRITNPSGGTCIAAGGTMKCLNVVISIAGQIRMCDPSLSQTVNPKGC